MTEKELNTFRKRIEVFRKYLDQLEIEETQPLTAEYCWSKNPVSFDKRLKGKYKSIKPDERWGSAWDSAWFHIQGIVPDKWKGKKVVAQLDFSGEALIYSGQGLPLQGLTHASIWEPTFKRDLFPLFDSCFGGEGVDLWIEAAANSLFGVFTEFDPSKDSPKRYGEYHPTVDKMRLCVFNDTIWHLKLDIDILSGLLKHLSPKSVRYVRILRTLHQAIDRFADNPANANEAREDLKQELRKPASASDLTAIAVGHAHIDTAWLWPVRETIRKCARTFASQIGLMEKYPEYVFGASQAQHYLFVKQYYPLLYEKIKKYIQEGRWEVQGGMWVEADCNLISGESMIRQILHGKNFFKTEFDVDIRNLWLPDVFGYSAAMPQILNKCGIEYFLTQKLSWNQVNDFPHTTFIWRGIDGSEVLTHFPPENTYSSQLNTEFILPGRDNFREKAFIDEFLCLFGIGDGGGGPKAENIEYGRRMADLEDVPKVKFGRADQFFSRLERYRKELPVWQGELYFEMHRGTYTSHALVKKANRKLELKLRELEILASCLPLAHYPQKEFESIWKKVLLNQFHDIIPGSSINQVYQETHEQHTKALEKCQMIQEQLGQLLFKKDNDSITLFNSLSCAYSGAIILPADWSDEVVDGHGNRVMVQGEENCLIALVTVPALSFVTFQKGQRDKGLPAGRQGEKGQRNRDTAAQRWILENERIRYEFNPDGTVCSAWDKEIQRENIEAGKSGNKLSLYVDRPNEWDAWDIDIWYEKQFLQQAQLVAIRKTADGAVRQGLLLRFKIGTSQIEQKIYLTASSKRLDFVTVVDWAEKHRMLRVSFPVTVYQDKASFDIQFGYVYRPTHRNTSFERAKFEVVAHKYADLSDADYGVALLNDCKYGYKVYKNTLDLNLLRAPTYPDPDCDQGRHEFTYSLLPHRGDLIHSDVMKEASCLNQPLTVFNGYAGKGIKLPCRLEGAGLSLEVIKKSEREENLIVRIVERLGCESKGRIVLDSTINELAETNLLEWTEEQYFKGLAYLDLIFKPFEIKTFKLKEQVAKGLKY